MQCCKTTTTGNHRLSQHGFLEPLFSAPAMGLPQVLKMPPGSCGNCVREKASHVRMSLHLDSGQSLRSLGFSRLLDSKMTCWCYCRLTGPLSMSISETRFSPSLWKDKTNMFSRLAPHHLDSAKKLLVWLSPVCLWLQGIPYLSFCGKTISRSVAAG